jgi:hypothetical protein
MATSNPSRIGKLCVRFGAVFVVSMAVSIIGPTGCGGVSSDKCRLDPEKCRGAAGALCVDDYDCDPGLECCTEKDNCGGGMCTLSCEEDYDCPADMLCEHSICFYACASDLDCAPEMSCEHDNTVCEYQ